MTNPDNVGGLLPCPGCGKSDLDHCPADFVAVNGLTRGMIVRCAWCHFAAPEAAWNRRELCRADPAGGDDYKAIEAALHDAKMTIETLRAGYARMAEAAGCVEDCGKASAIVLAINALRDQANRNDSAPAGSGEELAKWVEGARDYVTGGNVRPDDGDEDQEQWDRLTEAAALLRKLQQGADYVVVPREPSNAMVLAAIDRDDSAEDASPDGMYVGIYRAMVDASDRGAK